MKVLLFITSLLVFGRAEFEKDSIEHKWQEYKSKYSLRIEPEDDEYRKAIFIKNHRFIKKHNAENSGLTLEMNRFGHLSKEEIFKNGLIKKRETDNSVSNSVDGHLPVRKKMDWREYGVVSHVKNQLQCGSCYAFSAIGAIESHFAIKMGTMTLLSEQQIVDCTSDYGDLGCSGGFENYVFNYSITHGLRNESDYPYTGEEDKCRIKPSAKGLKIKSFETLPGRVETKLIRTLSFVGPVSVAMSAGFDQFIFYKSGIIKNIPCNAESVNHAILAVGYSLERDHYYIVKNSWGEDWGESGYFRISIGNNTCCIAEYPSYPII